MYDHYIYNSYDEVQANYQRRELTADVISIVSVLAAFITTLAVYAPLATA